MKKLLIGIVMGAVLAMGCGSSDDDDGGPPPPPPIEERSPFDGPSGFLWKPGGENTGNLVILLPPEFNDVTRGVELHRALPPTTETVIEGGRFTGVANGNRGHWRYARPGGAYGMDVVVLVIRTDETRVAFTIPNGSQRTD